MARQLEKNSVLGPGTAVRQRSKPRKASQCSISMRHPRRVLGQPINVTWGRYHDDPPENCHLNVKKLPKTWHFFFKKLPKNVIIFCQNISNGDFLEKNMTYYCNFLKKMSRFWPFFLHLQFSGGLDIMVLFTISTATNLQLTWFLTWYIIFFICMIL